MVNFLTSIFIPDFSGEATHLEYQTQETSFREDEYSILNPVFTASSQRTCLKGNKIKMV